MRQAKTRKEAEEQFWTDVKNLLTQKHGHSARKAQQGIKDYQQEVARPKLGGVVFNQGEELTAKVIDRAIREGLPAPSAS